MARRVRWGAEFSGFWGCYGIAIISRGLSQSEAVRDERKLIRSIRSGTKYSLINKSNGGEPGGYPLEKVIRDAVLEKYVRYLTEDVETQRFWSLERWKTNPRPECSVRTNDWPQLPLPPRRFRTMTECLREVVQKLEGQHMWYVEDNRRSYFGSVERSHVSDLIEYLE